MPDLIKVQTCDLSGKALLWAVELVDGPIPVAAGQLQLPLGSQAIDDATGEHLIQKHGIWIERGYSWVWLACVSGNPLDRQPGDTRAEAAARAVVHHARGETISVPKEMML
ncbi:hypothetical protein CMV24_14445 [Pseudomonas plecoglossicida]|uniref:DUF2591 domain-containing protein n=1 Tax=Pseudomonas plecoglossicida TaxID=70775 RepID=A0A2A3M3M1_PSEDL|nr:hypothetical protein [Pseudomonas plecoglossicida]PBJ94663.1 hypothetical protein CMV24_14445 [Pseudomonas plecoglossicida]